MIEALASDRTDDPVVSENSVENIGVDSARGSVPDLPRGAARMAGARAT